MCTYIYDPQYAENIQLWVDKKHTAYTYNNICQGLYTTRKVSVIPCFNYITMDHTFAVQVEFYCLRGHSLNN